MWGTPKRTYLDWAAAAPVKASSREAFSSLLHVFGNPGSPHQEGQRASKLLEEARTGVARMAEVKADGVIFTSGATEANALAIRGSMQSLQQAGRATSTVEVFHQSTSHSSVLGAFRILARDGIKVRTIPLRDGGIDLKAFEAMLTPETALVSVDAVCGETGTRYDSMAVRRLLDKHAKATGKNVLLHVDASQLPLVESFTLAHLGADLLTLDAQKVGGVRGVGALLVRHGVSLTPLMLGGGQEHGLRPGTPSPQLAHSFQIALEVCAGERTAFTQRAERMRTTLLQTLESSIPGLLVNTGPVHAPHILNVSLPGKDTDYACALLDARGFAVSTKSACETNEEGSRVVFAMTGDEQRSSSTMRISWGPTTKERELSRFATALTDVVRFLDSSAL